jgi:8-amino-7-oxononanoate synthase
MINPMDLWSSLSEDLQSRQNQGLRRSLVPCRPLSPKRTLRQGRSVLHFASNDYLAMAWNPQVREEFSRIADQYSLGATASPLILGTSEPYAKLVESIAHWHQSESAVVFPSGYAANLGTLQSLVSPEDLVLSDALNHACLIDGCRLSKATIKVFPHRDTDSLGDLLANLRGRFRMAYILTDTLFSMDGNVAPIRQIESLCREFKALAIADEAHASGVFGDRGRGLLDAHRADGSVWIKTGTLSKAIGCTGGYVAGSHLLCDTLLHRARTLIFSTALPPAILGAAAKSIQLIQNMDDQRLNLLELSSYLRKELTLRGFHTTSETTPIIPLYVHDPHEALRLSEKLLDAGIFVPAIRPPTVPPNGCLLRISLNSDHTHDDCQQLLDALG